MRLQRLQLTDYRNYHELDLAPSEGLNVLIGPNGQGKSNVLEAIYLLATTRSLRAHRDCELVRFKTDLARVIARISREVRSDVMVEIDVTASHKTGKVNGVRHARLVDLLGEFNAVQFTPTDVELISGPPSTRRSFLNLQIAQSSGSYAYSLIYYKRVLDQRNRLLKDSARTGGMSAAARQTLDTLTEQLISYGSQILERRGQFVDSLARYGNQIHRELAGAGAVLEVIYRPGWSESTPPALPADWREQGLPPADAFRLALEAVRSHELRRGTTLAGPHRDDLQFLLDEMDVRVYGSRGEQRTVALAMKLAEFLLLRELAGEPPVMLLDDALSELDDERSLRVIHTSVGPCQTFMTGASARAFPPEILAGARVFELKAGRMV
ncbi:MAG TPA: DNA replication/repair protein RecF [Armatimonadota bacterium]|nr:DNA replication/repair protein RecF [Armatimonadota bacterium]